MSDNKGKELAEGVWGALLFIGCILVLTGMAGCVYQIWMV